jgi:hypothetical protein
MPQNTTDLIVSTDTSVPEFQPASRRSLLMRGAAIIGALLNGTKSRAQSEATSSLSTPIKIRVSAPRVTPERTLEDIEEGRYRSKIYAQAGDHLSARSQCVPHCRSIYATITIRKVESCYRTVMSDQEVAFAKRPKPVCACPGPSSRCPSPAS